MGFADGYHIIDEEHPLFWPGKKQIGNWAKMIQESQHLACIRDVF